VVAGGRVVDEVAEPGLVTLGETMGLLVQDEAGMAGRGAGFRLSFAGAESNVAIGVRRLGVVATWLSRLGDDPAGDMIVRELRGEGVDVIAGRGPGPTGIMLRWRSGQGRTKVDYHRQNSAASRLTAADVPDELIVGAAVLHVTGITPALGPGPAEAVRHAVDVATAAGVPVALNVNYRRALWSKEDAAAVLRPLAERADVVLAGHDEARLLLGPGPAGDEPERAAAALAAAGPSQVVVTLGSRGYAACIDGIALRGEAVPTAVVDPVGAGDAFAAGYLAELIAGRAPQERLRTGAACGALAVSVKGDWEALPTRADLRAATDPELVQR
jgi:2-dehydro-3-deoxygluconokinase